MHFYKIHKFGFIFKSSLDNHDIQSQPKHSIPKYQWMKVKVETFSTVSSNFRFLDEFYLAYWLRNNLQRKPSFCELCFNCVLIHHH